MRPLLLVILFVAYAGIPATAQVTSGESEVGSAGKDGAFVSQYVFVDAKTANLLTRVFWVNDILSRFEIAIGPTFTFGVPWFVEGTIIPDLEKERAEALKGNDSALVKESEYRLALIRELSHNKKKVLKLQLGGTSDNQVMVAGTFSMHLAGHDVFYIGDEKKSVKSELNELYQKLFVSITHDLVWQFRLESLHIGQELAFLRLGVEYQVQFAGGKRHLYLAPFYDPVVGKPGGQVGFRFF